MKRLGSMVFLWGFALAILYARPAPAAEILTLMLDWFPNVDHVPVYAALEEGFFRDEGIELKILSPSDTADGLKLAAAGQVDLAVSYQPQAIIAAAGGLPIKVAGRLVAHPLTTLLFLKSSGFRVPSDLEGRTIGYTVPGLMDVLLEAFAKVNGIRNYTPVNVGFAIAPSLTSGKVAAVMGPFKTYETVTLAQAGIESDFFELERWGIPVYDELIFVCSEAAAERKAEPIRGFRRAVARGIEFVRGHPDRALADYFSAVPDADRETEARAFELTRPYFAPDQRHETARWRAFAEFALEHRLIERPVDVQRLLMNDDAEDPG